LPRPGTSKELTRCSDGGVSHRCQEFQQHAGHGVRIFFEWIVRNSFQQDLLAQVREVALELVVASLEDVAIEIVGAADEQARLLQADAVKKCRLGPVGILTPVPVQGRGEPMALVFADVVIKRRVGEGPDLASPRIPQIREAVEQQDQRPWPAST
jgi:hypothetical protein